MDGRCSIVMLEGLLATAGGYLLGSVPFGLLLTRIVGVDIRHVGSGNIGATNVLRTGRKGLALATLLLDGGKGAIAVVIANLLSGADAGLVAGICAVIGHNFPVWLKFKGGKGVATTFGTLLALAWPVALAAGVTWLLTAAVFRFSSLAALVALALSPVFTWALGGSTLMIAGIAVLAVMGILRHHANIRRLIRREEPRIGEKRT